MKNIHIIKIYPICANINGEDWALLLPRIIAHSSEFVFQVQIGWWRPGLYSWFVFLLNDRFDGTSGFGVVGEYLGWWKKFEPIRDRWVCF